jgi:drug/metabolite transporter (DMT)-like permease
VRREALALGAAAVVGVQVGACIAGSRWVVHDVGPVGLTFLRYAIGLASLLPFVAGAWRVVTRLSLREWLLTAMLGILQFGVLIALLNTGLARVDAGLGALLFATFPLLTMAVATLVGRERFDVALAAGVLLSVLGVGVALGAQAPGTVDAAWARGVVSVLAAALCGAVCAVLYRPLLLRHAMLPVGALAMASAVLVLVPAAWAEGLFERAAFIRPAQWVVVVAVGLSSGIAYWLWLWALKHTAPTKATAFLALSPVTAAVIGALALHEPAPWGLAVGIACILGGLALAAGRQVEPAVAG